MWTQICGNSEGTLRHHRRQPAGKRQPAVKRAPVEEPEMSRYATGTQEPVQECAPSLLLPADHVLTSGAVLFPGAFDQHGFPLIVFPVDGQAKLSSELSKAEVVDFINYFLCLHNKKQEKDSLVSVVADLRHASLQTIRFISETLILLEFHRRTVHGVYIIQPKKKDSVKLLLKLLAPSRSYTAAFKKVLLKDISELSNYIDRSQLTVPLGGYFIYCHRSWAAFIKEIDVFVQEFLSVVQRLPSCISTLHALSRLPMPSTFSELQHFCTTNEAKFQQLRRELGLDELLKHCESVVEKLRYPEKDPCYQAMAGTTLFTNTAFDMLQNHSRITAGVDKVELLWQQAFSKARLQLQVFQLREDALQITEQIQTLQEDKLQPYKMEIAKDSAGAVMLVSEFEVSIHTPAMALVWCAEDVINTWAEILPCDGQTREPWVLDLERLKEKLRSAVHFILQTLRAVSTYHHNYNKASGWYSLVLCENFLQELLSGVNGDAALSQRQRRSWRMIPAWRHKLSSFLKKNPPPDVEQLVHLAHLSNIIQDDGLQQAGKQMSQRCLTLRKLLISSGPVAVANLQLALQWQYELLRSSHINHSSAEGATNRADKGVGREVAHLLETSSSAAVSGMLSTEGKHPSLSSFDSGFDGAASSQLEAWGGREGMEGLSRSSGTSNSVDLKLAQHISHKVNTCSVSDFEDHTQEFELGFVGHSSRASIQIIPRVTVESLNFEIKVKRSAALPSNPWLSLPVDDLENSYTVTITQNPTPQKRDLPVHDPSEPCSTANHSCRCRDQPNQMTGLSRGPQSTDWTQSQSSMVDPELSPIHNILSSTITDGRDQSLWITEGVPTLLWDSYDLHDQAQDSADGSSDVSLKDWDVREQEGLREVEQILHRADDILEKEEHVLAQEAVLDALLRCEEQNNQWPPWDREDQLSVMSSNELTEAGVVGLEDYLIPAESFSLSEPTSAACASETKTSEDNGWGTAAATGAQTGAFHSTPDLLTELSNVHALDELIVEEKLKIQELRRCRENEDSSESKPSDTSRLLSISKDRETFLLQLEKEKKEADKLEKSLGKECEVKKHQDRAGKVVHCSIMEKARSETTEDRVLCDEFLSGSFSRTNSTSLVHNFSQAQDTWETEHMQAEAPPEVLAALPDPHCEDHCSEILMAQLQKSTLIITSNLKKFRGEEAVQPQGCIDRIDTDGRAENSTKRKPEASLTTEMRPSDGEFDPGGRSHLPPVPEPIKALLPVNDDLEEFVTPHSTELNPALSAVSKHPGIVQLDVQDKPLSALLETECSASSHILFINANVKEHCNNNNNNHALPEQCSVSVEHLSEMSTEDEEEMSGAPACSLRNDSWPEDEIQSLSPPQQSAPQQPHQQPELDSPGRDEQNDGVMRPGSQSAGIQAPSNISLIELTDFKTPIVLDTGSGLIKAGFADQDIPSIVFPTIIGMPKYEEIMNGDLERETYIGHKAQYMRGVLTLKHPIKNGIIRNWDEMEKIWHHTFQQLRVDPKNHPVLLTEAAMNPSENRQRMVEIMFENFSVPFTYVAMQAVLALYAAGKSTGVVFDSGDDVSHSVPVFEGYCLPHAVQRFPLAGVDVTMHLKKLLQEQGVSMRTTAEMEIVREMKEKCCSVALNYEDELSAGGSSCTEMHYTMPDGQIVTLSTERFRAPEILFKPELIGRDHCGIHQSVFKSILSSDIDLRRCFLGNIVLSGGNTLLAGLPERLQAEVKGLVPSDMWESVRVTSPKDRDFSVWSGGAVLANLPTFSSAWISQEEYEEYGPQIVYRKCF